MDTNRVAIKHDPNLSDRDLFSEVRAALGKQPLIRALDLDHFTISVKDGQVYLIGHVREKQLIEATIAAVVGKQAIHTELVDDRELAITQITFCKNVFFRYCLSLSISHQAG